jgi:chorismate--pyruvate lyase
LLKRNTKNPKTLKSPTCHYQIHREPHWRPRARLYQAELPPGLRDWLFDTGSLTRRLRQACPGQFEVKVLGQQWARPLPSEARVLGLKRYGYVWIREVQLFCDNQPWVFARTLIPTSTLRGCCKRLTHLGTRPLGAVLFTDPMVRRGEVEVARVDATQRLYRCALAELAASGDAIWGRRSVFYIHGQPLLVCEIFLPSLLLVCSAAQGDR